MKINSSLKLSGSMLVIFSILGLLFSFSGIAGVWIIRPRLRDSVSELLSSLEEALLTSQDGLTLLDQAVDDLLSEFVIIEDSFDSLNMTLAGISNSLETSANLIGDDLKQTVGDTRTALDSAATTAELIDNTLTFLSKIPLLGVNYEPEVPLHISLNQVADNLETFPTTLDQIETGLNETTDGLESLKTDLKDLSDQIQGFEDDLENAQVILGRFNDSIGVMETRLSMLNDNLPRFLTLISLFLTGVLFWLGFSQINSLTQGFLYLKGETTVVNLSNIQKQ
jgi:chromosome segregation ATPase